MVSRSTRRCSGSLASDSFVLKWLGEDEAGLRTRAAVIGECELVTVTDAGHMLHHDQPGRIAAVIEPFLANGVIFLPAH